MTDKTNTEAGVKLGRKEIEEAKKEGALDYIKEGSKNAMASDTGTTGDPEAMAEAESKRIAPDANTTFLAPLLDLGEDELKRRMTDEKADDFIAFEDAKGLLALERAGKNRTSYVKLLCGVLKVGSPYEVTNSGPPYTNDTSNISAL